MALYRIMCLMSLREAWTLGVIFVFYISYPLFVFLTADCKRAWFAFIYTIIIQAMCQNYFMTGTSVVENYNPKHSFCIAQLSFWRDV